MDSEEATRRADEWIAAWNSHDLDRILSHYTDDFTMSSPYVSLVTGEASGTVHGKAAVRAYWGKGLQRAPDLHFDLIETHAGVNGLALFYRTNVTGKTVVEVLVLGPDGRYTSGDAYNAV
ncbi:MAG: nuclear transport factor 2 family protein [Candidatus Eremiobacteraeota bacterium]|nr:nuclear transport factor 2 family protein [Candidatus Eremiobacteraeota bacterium]